MNILLAEDSKLLRTEIARELGAIAGVEGVVAVASVAEARRVLAEQEFDAAVLDFDLGDGNALDLLAERASLLRKPGAVAVVLTVRASTVLRNRCLAAGADHFFGKLDDWDMIRAAISERLESPPPRSRA